MTGFASLEGEHEGLTFQFDARSVNARSLDVRLRIPAVLESHETALRRRLAGVFRRGTITLTLAVRRAEGTARYDVDHVQLSTYLEAIAPLIAEGVATKPCAATLLALRGVVETEREDAAAALGPRLDALADDLFDALAKDRAAEGARIAPLIGDQLAEMASLTEAIDKHPERSAEALRARLDKQVAELLDPSNPLSVERLHQEAALLATRSDVREEVDRLSAHIAAARALLEGGGTMGRKLDFLAQEMHREANTICAKASHHSVTALGLELKAIVEQMREQVQNLE